MSAPRRIQLRRARGWRMPENTVKVDRSTKWGNPFIVGKHGTRAECVDLYTYLLAGYACLTADNVDAQLAARQHVVDHYQELVGRNLACWCPLDKPCHADVLIEMVRVLDGVDVMERCGLLVKRGVA